MAIICPTVLARNPHTFQSQMERIAPFAERMQIDLMDSTLTPHDSIDIREVWWPAGVQADLHLMYKHPLAYLDEAIALNPDLIIVHAEANGNFFELQTALKKAGIKVGLALLKQTPVNTIEAALDNIDHVLIFSGDLGSFGGHADIGLLDKVKALKVIKPELEIGWDGGVNAGNAQELIMGGVDVLDVGGYIQRAEHPAHAYATLKAVAEKANNG